MSRIKKIKGFTLLEILLTMSLTGLLVLIGGNVFFYFQKVQLREIQKIADQNHVLLLDLRLQKDFSEAYYAFIDGNKLSLKNLKKESIAIYEFRATKAIRRGSSVDTFFIMSSPNLQLDSSGVVRIRIDDLELSYQVLPFSHVEGTPLPSIYPFKMGTGGQNRHRLVSLLLMPSGIKEGKECALDKNSVIGAESVLGWDFFGFLDTFLPRKKYHLKLKKREMILQS